MPFKWSEVGVGDLLLGDDTCTRESFVWRDFVCLVPFRDYGIMQEPGLGGVKLLDLHRGKVHELVIHDDITVDPHTLVRRET